MPQPESDVTAHYRVDLRWVAAGLFALTLFALADAGRTWLWFPSNIPGTVTVYFLAIWLIYAVWVCFGILIGWLVYQWPLQVIGFRKWLALHALVSIAIGSVHLIADTIMVKIMYADGPLLSFTTIFAEKLVAWLPYELLGYWSCLAVFMFFAQRRAVAHQQDQVFQQRFAVKVDGETRLINIQDVEWIEAFDNYVILHTGTQRQIHPDTLSRLEQALDPAIFVRIHRSSMVNLNHVASLRPGHNGKLHVRLRNGKDLLVSRRRQPQIRRVVRSGKAA